MQLDDLTHLNELTRSSLLGLLAERREQMGLTQAELATRTGLNRMSVQRAEAEGADPQLSTFVALALALNLRPALGAAEGNFVAAADIVHRGLAHNRTRPPHEGDDRVREAALAASWETVNEDHPVGIGALMPSLVPGHTQEQATAAATVVQWLGSQVGFDFLQRALESAGYEIVPKSPKKKVRWPGR